MDQSSGIPQKEGEMGEAEPFFYDFDCYRVDAQAGRLLRDGKEVAIRGKEFQVLKLLVANGGQEVTKGEFSKKVWHDRYGTQGLGSLRTYISSLRKVLGDSPRDERYIART